MAEQHQHTPSARSALKPPANHPPDGFSMLRFVLRLPESPEGKNLPSTLDSDDSSSTTDSNADSTTDLNARSQAPLLQSPKPDDETSNNGDSTPSTGDSGRSGGQLQPVELCFHSDFAASPLRPISLHFSADATTEYSPSPTVACPTPPYRVCEVESVVDLTCPSDADADTDADAAETADPPPQVPPQVPGGRRGCWTTTILHFLRLTVAIWTLLFVAGQVASLLGRGGGGEGRRKGPSAAVKASVQITTVPLDMFSRAADLEVALGLVRLSLAESAYYGGGGGDDEEAFHEAYSLSLPLSLHYAGQLVSQLWPALLRATRHGDHAISDTVPLPGPRDIRAVERLCSLASSRLVHVAMVMAEVEWRLKPGLTGNLDRVRRRLLHLQSHAGGGEGTDEGHGARRVARAYRLVVLDHHGDDAPWRRHCDPVPCEQSAPWHFACLPGFDGPLAPCRLGEVGGGDGQNQEQQGLDRCGGFLVDSVKSRLEQYVEEDPNNADMDMDGDRDGDEHGPGDLDAAARLHAAAHDLAEGVAAIELLLDRLGPFYLATTAQGATSTTSTNNSSRSGWKMEDEPANWRDSASASSRLVELAALRLGWFARTTGRPQLGRLGQVLAALSGACGEASRLEAFLDHVDPVEHDPAEHEAGQRGGDEAGDGDGDCHEPESESWTQTGEARVTGGRDGTTTVLALLTTTMADVASEVAGINAVLATRLQPIYDEIKRRDGHVRDG